MCETGSEEWREGLTLPAQNAWKSPSLEGLGALDARGIPKEASTLWQPTQIIKWNRTMLSTDREE